MSFVSDSYNSTSFDCDTSQDQPINYYTSNHDSDKSFSGPSTLPELGNSFKKGRKGLPPVDPNAPCYIQLLSVELLTHVFAQLNPICLTTAAKVCHTWRHIINDDTCWKTAFVSYFGASPYKRLRPASWKLEYILRADLLRKWEKGRGTVMTLSPKIQTIDDISVDFESSSMIMGSTEHGLGAKCNIDTGKIERPLLFYSAEQIIMALTCVHVDQNRILWGSGQGCISLTIRNKIHDGRRPKVFPYFHRGAIRAFAFPKTAHDIFISAGDDSRVNIWSISEGSCIKTLHGVNGEPTCLEVVQDGCIIVGYNSGAIVIWDVQLKELVTRYREQRRNGENPNESLNDIPDNRRIISPPFVDRSTPIKSIRYDPKTEMLMVAYGDTCQVKRFWVKSEECVATFEPKEQMGTVTCMEWDTVLPAGGISIESGSKNISGYVKGSSDSLVQSTRDIVSVKTTQIMVTGDSSGTVYLWDGDSVQKDGPVRPLKVMNGHIGAISSIYIDAFKIVTGSDDGWIRIWNPISGDIINVLGNKVPRNAPVDRNDVSIMRVNKILCSDYKGVAAIGHHIKTWDFSPNKQLLVQRNLREKLRTPGPGLRDPKLHHEIKQELKESTEKLSLEKKNRSLKAKMMHKLTLGGLTDEEMLDYATMLSQEEMVSAQGLGPQASSSGAQNINDGDYINDEELLRGVIASLGLTEDGIHYEPEVSAIQTAVNPSSSPPQSSQAGCIGSKETNHDFPAIDLIRSWPTVNDSIGNSDQYKDPRLPAKTHNWGDVRSRVIEPLIAENQNKLQSNSQDDEYDEELQYVLMLSRGEI
ncbi:WD40-repeat-containing domain protein [Phycomyces nitens]|nr:WD40-repeat-containing domain protein [Phycomyces nitens]